MFQQIVGADGDMTSTTIIYINMLQDRFALIKKKAQTTLKIRK